MNDRIDEKLLLKIHATVSAENACVRNGDHVGASKAGLKTWGYLKELMHISGAKNINDIFEMTMYDFLSWASSFADNLHNASLKDDYFFDKKYLFCKEYVDMHKRYTNKKMRNLGNIRQYFADCYSFLGDLATCDNLYEQWLKKEPDWGCGWIGWSDIYWLFLNKNKPNFTKAKSILESGLTVRNVDDKYEMTKRLNDLNNEIALQDCSYTSKTSS